MTDERVVPVAAVDFGEPTAPVVSGVAQHRKSVEISNIAVWVILEKDLVETDCMTEFVLRDRAEREVFFEEGAEANPVGVSSAHHVLVISERQQVCALYSLEAHVSSPSRRSLRRAATRAPSL